MIYGRSIGSGCPTLPHSPDFNGKVPADEVYMGKGKLQPHKWRMTAAIAAMLGVSALTSLLADKVITLT
jgi:hypothetical protein